MILVVIHYSAMITFVSLFFYHSLVGRRSNILDMTSVDIMYVTKFKIIALCLIDEMMWFL